MIIEAFHLNFKGRCRKPIAGSESLQVAPQRAICEPVRVKPKLHWRLQDVGDTRKVGHLSRKAIDNK